MKRQYDFSKLRRAKPRYMRHLRKSVTIRVDENVIAYFRKLAHRTGLSCQSLMNFVLRDYASKGLVLRRAWCRPRTGPSPLTIADARHLESPRLELIGSRRDEAPLAIAFRRGERLETGRIPEQVERTSRDRIRIQRAQVTNRVRKARVGEQVVEPRWSRRGAGQPLHTGCQVSRGFRCAGPRIRISPGASGRARPCSTIYVP